VLLTGERIRKHYSYTDDDVVEYCRRLTTLASIVSRVPEVRIVRDPNDDMIVACAIAAGANYVVTRDKDMLSLDQYKSIRFVTPEGFLKILRERMGGTGTPGDN
jgi:predicted nucleic acid-binding protein